MEEALPRKLAVILHADVVGSTTLVQKNESIAHQRIQAAFHRLCETIRRYHGSTHEIRGDALVAEFARASDAVCAALAFQSANAANNQEPTDDICPELRVGISLGEVIIADRTMTGAGVVMAQRLEQLASPGGVIVQGAVAEALPTRLPLHRESLGEQRLKGFEHPVGVFSISMAPDQQIPEPERILASLLLETSKAPTVAVLPFIDMSGSPSQDFLSDGLFQDLITFLSKFGRYTVSASHSVSGYKEHPLGVQQVASELGVRYMLEGSVQYSGERLRINVQLSDGVSGQQIWAERYKRDGQDSFDVQDELVEVISATLAHKIDAVEAERGLDDRFPNDAAYEHYVKGREIFFSRSKQTNREARQLMEKTIELDPTYARAYGFLAWLHVHDYRYGWSENPQKSLDVALDLALKAISLDPSDYESHWRIGFVYLYRRQFDKATTQYERARTLNPNHAGFLAEMAGCLVVTGKAKEAITQIERAMRINPHYPEWFEAQLAWARFENSEYEGALRSLNRMNNPAGVYRPLIVATYIRLARTEEAKSAAAELLLLEPDFKAKTVRSWPYQDISRGEQLENDLLAAGIPA